MKTFAQPLEPVVLLVDSRTRDLPVATLIAHHLRELGAECFLEPLESYRAVLAAYRPGLIIFNHLTAGHLAAYSRRLAKTGVLTAVLPNEGISYDAEERFFNSGRHHRDAHIDLFFCWNEPHRQTLLQLGFGGQTRIEVIGVPRFDFYFAPWSRLYHQPPSQTSPRPRILLCTNFGLAKFHELPREEGDKFFAAWKDRISICRNYRQAIEDNYNARRDFFPYLDRLVGAGKFNIVLRPHPREDAQFYQQWWHRLPAGQKVQVTIDSESSITSLILQCDLEISCENCTTALESWIAGKRTVELVFARNPMFFTPEHAACNMLCDNPDQLVPLVEAQLQNSQPDTLQIARREFLQKWCNKPDGRSCRHMAETIVAALKLKRRTDWSKLNVADYRRALKLKLSRSLGFAYHYNPFLSLKSRLFPQRYIIKESSYEKSIKPRDIREARLRLEKALTSPPAKS